MRYETNANCIEEARKKNIINHKKYYVFSYIWNQYAEGITGFDRSYTVYTGDGNGYDRKDATVLKNKLDKEVKSKHKLGTKGKKDHGYGIVGSTSGLQKSIKGDQLEKFLIDFKNRYSYHCPLFNFVQHEN